MIVYVKTIVWENVFFCWIAEILYQTNVYCLVMKTIKSLKLLWGFTWLARPFLTWAAQSLVYRTSVKGCFPLSSFNVETLCSEIKNFQWVILLFRVQKLLIMKIVKFKYLFRWINGILLGNTLSITLKAQNLND